MFVFNPRENSNEPDILFCFWLHCAYLECVCLIEVLICVTFEARMHNSLSMSYDWVHLYVHCTHLTQKRHFIQLAYIPTICDYKYMFDWFKHQTLLLHIRFALCYRVQQVLFCTDSRTLAYVHMCFKWHMCCAQVLRTR